MRFDVLSRDLNVFESHFLEASAGTGKTFAIEHLVARLLIEGEQPFLIEQVLVVTFTRAAARELKTRIRKNLLRVKEDLLKSSSQIDYIAAVLEKGEEAAKKAIERLDAALICFDQAQIYTLHGFCYRILKEFAFEAGVNLEVSDPDEHEHLPLITQMAREYLLEDAVYPDYSPTQIKAVLRKYSNHPRKMIAALTQLISSGKEIASFPSYQESLADFLHEIASFPEIDAAAFAADMALLSPHYKQMSGSEIPAQIALLADILSSKKCSQEQFDFLLESDFFLEKLREENRKARSKLPEASALRYPDLAQKLQRALVPTLHEARDPNRTFLRLAKDVQIKSRELLEKRETFSPDGLLLKVEEAIQVPSFTMRVRQKYLAAIVDEFQDTDPVQWRIFQTLFPVQNSTVCLVGDPKQSIYAFRNADVYVYLEAAKAMGESSKKYLDTNFRSTEPLVDALNLLFSKARKGWMGLPKIQEALAVSPVKAGASLSYDAEAPIEFFIAAEEKGRHKNFPTSSMLKNKVFPYLAREIQRLHQDSKMAYHDIAILIKDRYQGKSVIDYLKKCGIPANAKRGMLITETDAYPALKELLFAACAPSDMSRLKAALIGPIIALQEADLEGACLLEAKAKMQLLSHTLFEKGFASFFQSLLMTAWGSSPEVLLQALFSRGDQQLYFDLRQLSELLIEEEMTQGLKAEALLSFLEGIAVQMFLEEGHLKVASQEERGSVTVMTMHMSKGLEFEAVFALGLASRHKVSEQMVVKKDGKSLVTLFEDSNSLCLSTIEEQDAEKMRQLYVALTRAKRRLYVPLMIEVEGKGLELGEAAPAELFFAQIAGEGEEGADLYRAVRNLSLQKATGVLDRLSPLINYRILEDAPEFKALKTKSASLILLPPSPLALPDYSKQILSFSTLAKGHHFVEVAMLQHDAPLSPHTMPLGAETGVLLHTIFEKIFKRALHCPLQTDKIAALIEEEVAFSPLSLWKEKMVPWVVALLQKPILSFSLCDIPKTQLCQEMEFFYQADMGMMKGFQDLVFEFAGKYYLLDWKSNYLGGADADYTQENIVQAMRQNQYFLQASIYADALERYVKLFDTRPFSEIFGGAIYYFIRGQAAFHFFPERFS